MPHCRALKPELRVALVSIGNCPSLALRNLRAYSLADADLAPRVRFDLHDYDVRGFREARSASSQQWSFATKFDEAVGELVEEAPDLLAFSCYLWNTELSIHLARLIKRLLPDVTVVLGGPDAGPRAAELLIAHREVDFVIEGDGEVPFTALLRTFLEPGNEALDTVPGLRYRRQGEVVANAPAEQKPDLARLGNVWERPPTQAQLAGWAWPHLLVETVRGCPYSCSFCMYGKSEIHAKETGAVIAELSGLLERGLLVEIVDPTFTTHRRRAKEILRALSAREYSGQLTIEAYPDSLDEEMADLLVTAQVCCVGLGFQTASAVGLEAVNRPSNLARFERAVGFLQERNLHFYVDIIYGLPGTSIEDFFATVDYLAALGVTRLMIYRLLGLPGSPMMAEAERYGLVFSPVPPYELLRSDTYSHDDIVLCERFRQAYDRLPGDLGGEEFRRLVERAGGVAAAIREYLATGGGEELPAGFDPPVAAVEQTAGGPA